MPTKTLITLPDGRSSLHFQTSFNEFIQNTLCTHCMYPGHHNTQAEGDRGGQGNRTGQQEHRVHQSGALDGIRTEEIDSHSLSFS